jgi:YidC/Oxa1 family membrane protein insertase
MSTGTRTLIAFLLVLAILLFYNRYLSRRPQPTPEKEIVPQEKVEEEAPPEPVEPEVISGVQKDSLITVETELFRVVLSSLEGTITSFQLKEYEGIGGGWVERMRDLEEWTEEEMQRSGGATDAWERRKATLNSLTEWMKNSYMKSRKGDVDEWVRNAEERVQALKRSYAGLSSECDERIKKIEKFPEWLKESDRGWVELIPQLLPPRSSALILDFVGDKKLYACPCSVERETTGEEEVVHFHYRLSEDEQLTKSFIFRSSDYLFDVRISGNVEHQSLSWKSGLAVTEGNRDDDLNGFASVALMGGQLLKRNLGALAKKREPVLSGNVEWVGVKTKYFFAGIIPQNASHTDGFEAYVVGRSAEDENQNSQAGFGCMPYRGAKHSGNSRISVSLLCPQEKEFSVYIGPIDYEELSTLDVEAERIVDFGWSWIAPLSRFLFRVLKFFRSFIPNYGVVIIVFSIIMKLIFYPLTHRGTRSMRAMAKLQPEMKRIQKQYKSDPKRMNREVMELYRRHKVNPIGGCLPLLIQMPIFIALYSILRTTIELRRAPFIPFWITDLSVKDPIYVLPLLMGVFMLLQSLFTPTDPRQRWTTFFMPVVITVIFLNFPAGLVLYWLVNNIFSVAEHLLLSKKEVVATQTDKS